MSALGLVEWGPSGHPSALSLIPMRAPLLLSLLIATVTSCSPGDGDGGIAPTSDAQEGARDVGAAGSAVGAARLPERWFQAPPTSQDYGPHEIRLGQATLGYLSQAAIATEAMPLLPPGIGGTVLTYSLVVESTLKLELFALFVPDTPAGVRRPLLTAFHGFGTTHRDIDIRTRFFLEAEERDWFLVAPLQRSVHDPSGANFDINYASEQSQLHVDAVLDYVLSNYPIDTDRVYGVGFSMGGGSALSYAARHRDPRKGAFAAVVNHTGTVALRDEYRNLPTGSSVVGIMEQIFGGPPSVARFAWTQSSLIELDDQAQLVPGGQHMAVNLAHVPVQTWFNTLDQLAHLPAQAEQLDLFMQGLPGAQHSLVTVPGGIADCGQQQHCWSSLDQTMACDWLATHRLNSSPTVGQLMIDRSGRWEYFDVEQDLVGKFSSLTYEVDSLGNSLTLRAPDNLTRIETTIADLGFSTSGAVKLSLEGFGIGPDFVQFGDISSAPVSVLRDGLPIQEDCGGTSTAQSWCYDASTETLILYETLPALSSWRIDF